MRGGTSKGVFFHAHDLPEDPAVRDRLLLSVMGSPDPYAKQIDGLGGATSSTSKIVIIRPSQRADSDIDYLFGHVAVERAVIDYSGNCGNLSSAVGVFAIEQGLVKAADPVTTVRVWQANLAKRLRIHVPSNNQGVISHGDYAIAGVPGSGAPISVEFLNPGDGSDGSALPTGDPLNRLTIDVVGTIPVSLVNAGNPCVFIEPEVLGLAGVELPEAINAEPGLLEKVESIRCAASVAMKLTRDVAEARRRPGTPKVAWVCPQQSYSATDGTLIQAEQIDLCARIFSMGRLHHAYTGTGAIALAVAAAIPGTLVTRCLPENWRSRTLRIGHSAGIMDAEASIYQGKPIGRPSSASIRRTARSLMSGIVFIG